MTEFSMLHLTDRADIPPGRPAIMSGRLGGEVITYGTLGQRVRGVTAALERAGVGPGDRVGFLGVNSPAAVEVLLGCAQIGAVGTYFNWRLAAPELALVLADSSPALLIVDRQFVGVAGAAIGSGGGCPMVIRDDGSEGDTTSDVTDVACSYESWRDGAESSSASVPDPSADDVAVQLYTSGTTGVPKGAMLTHRGFADAMPDTADFWGLDGESRMLSVLPMFHIAGIGTALATLWAGATLVIAHDASAEATLQSVADLGLTHLVLASVMLQGLVDSPAFTDTDLSTLRTVSYGAAPIAPSVLATVLERLDCAVMQPYGLTETTGVLTALTDADHRAAMAPGGDSGLLRTCGTARPGVELRVVEPTTGVDVEPGEPGELWARSARIMAGYWNRPDQTAEALTPDGWFRTGDVATMTADGFVELRDRLNDMIISGGENVYPVEVENVLHTHPDIAHAAVVGVAHERWGETPVAVIVPESGSTPTAESVIAFTRDRLAHYKCPTEVHVAAELPRNATGKVLRKELRNDQSWRAGTDISHDDTTGQTD